MQFCCQLLLLFTVLFVIQIAFLPNGSANAEEIIPIAQSSVLKLLQCLVEYDYKQKARPIREMPRNELASNDEVKGPEGKKQMEYFMSAYFEMEDFVNKCTEKDKQLNQLVKSAILSDSNPAGSIKESNGKRLKHLQLKSEMTNQQSPEFIEKGKEWLKKEFNEIKTAGGWIYENRGSPRGVFGTRSNKFQKALRFWRRFLTPYSLAVKGSILEVAKILFGKLQEKTKSHTLIEAIKMLFGKMKEIFGSPEHLHFNWELKRIEDEFEADKLITKYTYHNYYVGDEDKFVPREETGEVDKDGKKIYESIEAHEEKNTYFDKAYKNHLENIENLMKKVEIVPDNVMGPHLPNSLPFPLAIPKANRVFWVVRRLSDPKEDKDLSKDQISLIKSDLTNAFEHIPIKKMNIIMVEYKKQDPVEDTPENRKKFKDINEENKKREKANAEGPGKMATKNKEAEITARHILGKRNLGKQKVEIIKIGPMKEKKQYVQGEPFGPGDDDDLPTTIDIMKIVTGTAENVHPQSTDEASSSHHGKDAATATGSLLTEEEIKKIMSHQKSKQPAFNAKDWLAPGEEKKEHIVLVADLALILALQQLVDSKYKYAAPGCILKLVEIEGGSSHAQNGLENGLQGLRLISGGIYKHLGKLGEHKDKNKAFFEKYFTN